MDKTEIFVPILPWLIGGSRIGGGYNYYTGSRGTDPMTGCISNKVFNYRIWIEKNDEHEVLKAAAYTGTASFENQSEDDIETTVYELEEESRELIKNWLEDKYKMFLSQEK